MVHAPQASIVAHQELSALRLVRLCAQMVDVIALSLSAQPSRNARLVLDVEMVHAQLILRIAQPTQLADLMRFSAMIRVARRLARILLLLLVEEEFSLTLLPQLTQLRLHSRCSIAHLVSRFQISTYAQPHRAAQLVR